MWIINSLFIILLVTGCVAEDKNLKKGNEFFAKKDYDEALIYYEEAIKQKEDYASAEENISHTLYTLSKSAYEAKEYSKVIVYVRQLLAIFPESAYKRNVIELSNKSKQEEIKKLYKGKDYSKTLKRLKEYELSTSGWTKDIRANSLYEKAKEHYSREEYYIAQKILSLILNTNNSLRDKKELLEEEILYKDGLSQYERGAYRNSNNAFLELLLKYPKSKYKEKAKEYLSKLKESKFSNKTSQSIEAEGIEDIEGIKGIESLKEKGEKESPYKNADLVELVSYLEGEKLKNKENLKKNILVEYEGKHVTIRGKLLSYKENRNKGLLDRKTRGILDNFLKKESNKELSYKYEIILEQLANIRVLVKEEAFLKLDLRQPKRALVIEGQILNSKLSRNDEIQILVITTTVKQV